MSVSESEAGGATRALHAAWVLTREEFKATFRGLRMMLLVGGYGLLVYTTGRLCLLALGEVESRLAEKGLRPGDISVLDELKSPEMTAQLKPVLEWLGIESLFQRVLDGVLPWPAAIVLAASSVLLPSWVLLLGYDRIAQDTASRYVRYVFLRAHRAVYLLSKLLGLWLGIFAGLFLVQLASAAGASFVPALADAGLFVALPRIWLAQLVFLLPYCALILCISAVARSTFGALALSALTFFCAWFVAWVSDFFHSVWLGPADFRVWALEPAAIGLFVAHALFYFLIALAVLVRRDA